QNPSDGASQYCRGDICDVDGMTDNFRGQDAVFHLAAMANARDCLADPVRSMQVNAAGTAAILEAARRAKVDRVLLASTVWVFNAADHDSVPESGDGVRLLGEDVSLLPIGGGHPYTTSKIAAELLCHDFQRLHGLNFTILRYGIPYGPGMWPGLVLRSF